MLGLIKKMLTQYMNGPLVQHVVNNKMLNGEVIRIDGALRMMP